jgi:hypothetical protein
MSGHTPGPWRRAAYLDNPARSALAVVATDGSEIAHVHGWAGEPDTTEADADLIAASPTLLAFAEHVARSMPRNSSIAERAREVIAKARGMERESSNGDTKVEG